MNMQFGGVAPSVLDAAFAVVHDAAGGASALGVRLGKNPSTLSHEVAGHGTAKLGLSDAVKITLMTRDLRILNSFAAACGCMVVPMPDVTPSASTAEQVGQLAREFGDVVNEVMLTMADGKVSTNELHRCEKEWGELVAVGQAVMQQIRHMHEQTASEYAKGVRHV